MIVQAMNRSVRLEEISERLKDIHAALRSSALSLDQFNDCYRNNKEYNRRWEIRMKLHCERNSLEREREELYR